MIRIGNAYDTHRLVENRDLILGGVKVDYRLGLLGHSDADVVLHAIANAFLGSLALGDLGTFFPDTASETLNMDSKEILRQCYKKVTDKGYKLVNMDVMIFSQEVKINPIREEIRKNVAGILNCSLNQVSIKATTGEHIGYIGRNEGISCEATLLISND
ncbi:MAG: 2-C-methyl-D-erythritol 2,4-cyclodiphosphate synthase [Acholeplasmatales bacterium]|nr:2-C-methyl-D-erythritol 2,4-cyclodiphosphate synthase [Acholeplasmatales bacterium]